MGECKDYAALAPKLDSNPPPFPTAPADGAFAKTVEQRVYLQKHGFEVADDLIAAMKKQGPIRAPCLVLDVGANVGAFSTRILEKTPCQVCVESRYSLYAL